MRAIYKTLGSAAGISILAACTGGQAGIEPPSTAANVQGTSTLQFRVGTVNWRGLATFTNTVVTFRQPNGLSATLYNSPTITGPAGFVVPTVVPTACLGTSAATTASGAGTDAGTANISSTQPTQPGTTAVATTFAQVGGAFAYGFAPADSTTGGAALYAGNPAGRLFATQIGTVSDVYPQPIYCSSTRKLPYVLAPPATTPDFHNPALGFPGGFIGYDSGFMTFGVAPVAGSYALHLTVPSATIGVNSAVFDQTASITTTTPMATVAPVVIAEPGGAGTAVTFSVAPAPAGATSQVLYVVNQSTGTYFSFNAGTAGGVFSLAAANFTAGDVIRAYVAAANWDIVGDGPPANTSTAPPLPTQTDVSLSTLTSVAYL
ncbi:MAG: hypothetical protein QOD51_620 [Candidatus Eremiobacteraeota bacterium]|nr:hypothetical protein [Candidatus Eremiobacteraeota bacterium]